VSIIEDNIKKLKALENVHCYSVDITKRCTWSHIDGLLDNYCCNDECEHCTEVVTDDECKDCEYFKEKTDV